MIVQIVCKVLRQCAMASQGRAGFDFETFQKRLNLQTLTDTQTDLLEARLELLKDFVRPPANSESSAKPLFGKNKQGEERERNWKKRNLENIEHAKRQAAIASKDTWSFMPGSLTIVVSGPSSPDPFVQAFQWI